MKFLILVIAMAVIGVTIGVAGTQLAKSTKSPKQLLVADWSSKARTVDEVAREAEIIVRVRAESTLPTRALVSPLSPNSIGPGRPTHDVVPFTETRMTVLETFKGDPDKSVLVSQTGGYLPATDEYPVQNIEFSDDPLYEPGDEYVLFLIPTWTIEGVQIYSAVNPWGRYQVEHGNTTSPAEDADLFERPSRLDQLVSEIDRAIRQPS